MDRREKNRGLHQSQQLLGFSFRQYYPLRNVGLFLLLSNLGLAGLGFSKYIFNLRKSIKVDDIEMQLNHAIATVNAHTTHLEAQKLCQLQHEFTLNSYDSNPNLLKVSAPQLLHQSMQKDLKLIRSVLGKGHIQIYHKNGKVRAGALRNENNQLLRKVFFFEGGVYDQTGTRLDKEEVMLRPLSVVTQTGPKKPRISSGYGMRIHPILKSRLFHAGVDIAVGKNSPIHAALDGVVKVVAYNRGYGTYVILRHRNNLETLYAHMESVSTSLSIGKQVKQGEVIGKVGKTGRATSYHVHFETRVNGKHVDPASIRPMKYKLQTDKLKRFKAQVEELTAEMRILGI